MRHFILAVGVSFLAAFSARADTDVAKAEKIVAKGGTHWSAPERLQISGAEVRPGKRVWFWPADDEVHEVVNNHVTLRLQWALQPGQKPFKQRQGLRLAVHSSTDPAFSSSTLVHLAPEEESGIFEAKLPVAKLDLKGQADLLLHLQLEEPQSNLIQLKVRFGQQARVPRIIR